MSRGGMKITRSNDYEHIHGSAAPRWLENLAARLDQQSNRTAVEVSRERYNAPSFSDRINAIMGNSNASPYTSVEEAVQDYQKRTGLLDYQKQTIAEDIIAAGLVSMGEDPEKKISKPELLTQFPETENYIRNVIDSQPGIQLPAILHGIMELFGHKGVHEGDVYGPEVCRFINDLLKNRVEDRHESIDLNLGRGVGTQSTGYDLNDANRDPFINLTPKRL